MRIEDVYLYSPDLQAQEAFYGKTLGFIVEMEEQRLRVDTGQNRLYFYPYTGPELLYHFAFLIPTGSLESAMDFLKAKGLSLLPHNDSEIIHFPHGRAIYFEDADRNIAEFIERPLIQGPSHRHFDAQQVVRLNEVSTCSRDTLALAERLTTDYGIKALHTERFTSTPLSTCDTEFCWVGDHEGVILVAREGRHWLPTQRPAIPSPFSVTYTEEGQTFTYSEAFDGPIL
jgi:catechol 2,3-dioxygenase-like lactoylglutathione lyase family enzyme